SMREASSIRGQGRRDLCGFSCAWRTEPRTDLVWVTAGRGGDRLAGRWSPGARRRSGVAGSGLSRVPRRARDQSRRIMATTVPVPRRGTKRVSGPGSVDPVAAQARAGDVDHVLQRPAVRLDGANRPDVVVVAGEQGPIDAERPSDDEGLPEDLRGAAAAAVLGDHAVADVAALAGEVLVQLVADRRAANDLAVHLGDEERGRDEPRAEVEAAGGLVVEPDDVGEGLA